ncbi:helix-turn-helix domain-containing protein [Micromonospora aurantiaca]|uniref:helix-turn-helix domain-containing protein n=1 Tax=Micromonospora aurantiaca (nom. illeg.) TaxID=47850 RepID=UPI0034318C63
MRQERGMSRAELLALPVAFDLETACKALQMGRTRGYDQAKRGEFPVRVLRIGKAYRVTRADLFRYLGEIDDPAQAVA